MPCHGMQAVRTGESHRIGGHMPNQQGEGQQAEKGAMKSHAVETVSRVSV